MGFLSKLFSHKSVEEVADEIANTYAEEVQAITVDQTDTAGAETEQVNMLEVSDTGEIKYTEKAETEQGESPPQEDIQTADPSEVRRHIITFRVNDAELAAINRRYEQTSFKSRGDYCRYSALTVMNVELSAERIAYKKEADRLSRLAQQKRDSQRTLSRYMENEQAAKRKKSQLE